MCYDIPKQPTGNGDTMEQINGYDVDPNDSYKSIKIDELASALAKAQIEMDVARKSKNNPFFKSKYADLATVIEACRSALGAHDICFAQTTQFIGNRMVLVTRLIHKSGQWIKSEMPLPETTKPQDLGSCLTYFRRYSLLGITGLAVDDDDDGNKAQEQAAKEEKKQSAKTISDDQAFAIEEALMNNPDRKKKMLAHFGVSSVEQLPLAQFDRVMKLLAREVA